MSDIIISGLNKRFGEKQVLCDFSVHIADGEVICIMGPSGCGKTTLLNILMGLEFADGGTVAGMPGKIAAVFQEDRLCEAFRAVSNIRLTADKGVTDDEILDMFDKLGMKEAMNEPVSSLSGGMKRRVAIARALLAESDVLILDEPFKGLDEKIKADVIRVVRNEKKTIIMVSHDPKEAEMMCARVVQMKAV